MGHVSSGEVRIVGASGHVQGRQHRGAPGEGVVLTVGPDAAGRDRRRAIGTAGEQRAAAWYEARGYRVLARNWRSRQGEIDLIAERSGTVVFCEVKARSGTGFGEPFEAVTRAKQLRLRRLAAEWLRAAPRSRAYEVRFDVASIQGDHLSVLEAAF